MIWNRIPLGEVCRIKHGFAFKGEHFSNSGQYVLLTPGNFQEAGGLKLKGDKEKYYNAEFPSEYLLSENDMLVVLTDLVPNAPILGGAAYIPSDKIYLHNQRLGKVTSIDKAKVHEKFLYYTFNSPKFRHHVRASATGSTVRHTAPDRIYTYEVSLPARPIQQRIADILSAYDDLIENNLQRIQLLEEAARCRYKLLMEDFSTDHRTCTVYDYADVLSGGTPKTDTEKYWNGAIPFFTPKDVGKNNCYYLNDTERRITESGLEKCNSRLFPIDTVFITARGTVGKVVLASQPSAMSQSSYALRSKDGSSQYYLFLALINKIEHFKQVAVGGVFDTIIIDTFKQIQIETVPKTVLNKFHESVTPLFQQLRVLQKQNVLLREARDIFLPRLMSGEIDVSTVDEPGKLQELYNQML
jgi:type I restriction enzyme S subunit